MRWSAALRKCLLREPWQGSACVVCLLRKATQVVRAMSVRRSGAEGVEVTLDKSVWTALSYSEYRRFRLEAVKLGTCRGICGCAS